MISTTQCIVEHQPTELDFEKWQKLVDMMAKLFDAASGVIVQYRESVFNVVSTSDNNDNFLEQNVTWPWDMKSFCRRIMETDNMLYVNNAKADLEWVDAPPVNEGPVRSYLGYPLYWPDGSLFGSFCVIDTKDTDYSQPLIEILEQLKLIVESDLKHVFDTQQIKLLLAEKIDIEQLVDREQEQVEVIKNALSLQESINTATLASLADVVIRIDVRGTILSCNSAIESMFDYTTDELIGQNIEILAEQYAESCDAYLTNFRRAHNVGKEQQVNARRKDGSTFPTQLSVSEIKVGNEIQFIGLISDVTEKVRNHELLKQLALYDPLTNSANRHLLSERFEYELTKARRGKGAFSIAYIDLNKFKPINDQHGHSAGDVVLIKTVERLSALVRKHDLVARIGGDEFIILFGQQVNVAEMKEKISSAIEQAIEYKNVQLMVSASIGVATYPHDGESMKALLDKADTDMYAGKSD
jgi:diguanylate cyclase (GGDEF)-like protein/PAS domain S-box-containing protein